MKAITESLPAGYFDTLAERTMFHSESSEIVKLINDSFSVNELKENFKDKEYNLLKFRIKSDHMNVYEKRYDEIIITANFSIKNNSQAIKELENTLKFILESKSSQYDIGRYINDRIKALKL